ncbi:hypothetical protein [Cellulomonas sp. Root485]|uniref:hypothetical protein n=1 Tax=Cellulomonas sp. Root485 TaxID=1736546 RepID=UPI0012F963E6|nr:hypothetical protein [Cellulomonas sp. Root485]
MGRSTVSALTGLGLIAYIASRIIPSGTGAMVVGLVSLVPLGAAVVIAVRRRLGGAIVPPVLLFVGVAILSAVRLA